MHSKPARSERFKWHAVIAVLSTLVCVGICLSSGAAEATGIPIRFAAFNASLFREEPGELIRDLRSGDAQAKVIAEIIQRVRPDVLLINEFDFDPDGTAAELFQTRFLSVGQNGAEPIRYPYVYVGPVNTGVPTGYDLNNNGNSNDLGDLVGYGLFEGQYGMVLYSVHPMLDDEIRTFRNFLWKDMPRALLPKNPTTSNAWYSDEELAVLPLSSKSHWDIPILVSGQIIHVLASHPTPPVYDGAEDANGCRNHDEIRFWADFISPMNSRYIYDDAGQRRGLDPNSHFVIMGDQNADPVDGDSTNQAVRQILNHPLVNTTMTPGSDGAVQQAALQGGVNHSHVGDPYHDTADWGEGASGNLRADYVLPSVTLNIADAGVFWPLADDPLFRLVGTYPFPGSDHRLVWVDVAFPAEP